MHSLYALRLADLAHSFRAFCCKVSRPGWPLHADSPRASSVKAVKDDFFRTMFIAVSQILVTFRLVNPHSAK